MILHDLKLREFKEVFNSKKRKPTSDLEKFKTFKNELIEWSGEDLYIFDDLEIYMEGFSLVMKYRETTNTIMKLRFVWNLQEVDIENVNKFIDDFCKELKVKKPRILITEEFMWGNLGLYYPEDRQLVISEHTILQLRECEVQAIIKHELIHHYCNVKGLGARDIDPDFINLIVEKEAYISLAPEAQAAYYQFIANLKKNGSGFACEVFKPSEAELLYKKWLLRNVMQNKSVWSIADSYAVGNQN